MTQIRLTNINSPVNRALYAFKTYEEAAKAANVEVSTVMQWRASDRVPTEHLLTLSQKANMNVFELLNYLKSKPPLPASATPKPLAVLDALLTGTEHPALPDVRRKQMLTLWGDRLPLLRDTLRTLVDPVYPNLAAYSDKKAEAARLLNVTPRQIDRLLVTFQAKRKPFSTQIKTKETSKEAQARFQANRNLALEVIKGYKQPNQAAKDADITPRQLYRYIGEALQHHSLTLTVLSKYPTYFRLAVAKEIEAGQKVSLALKIRKVYDEITPRIYSPPDDLHHAPYRDKMIAVLMAEVDMHDLTLSAPMHAIEEAFNAYCLPNGFTWRTLRAASLYHQAFFAECLKSFGPPPVTSR